MNVVKCSNGHFFDGDAYAQCPHCGAAVASAGASAAEKTPSKRGFSWFDRDKKKNSDGSITGNTDSKAPVSTGNSDETVISASDYGVPANASSAPIKSEPSYDCGETVSLLDNTEPAIAPVAEPESSNSVQKEESQPAGGSLKDVIKKASANEEGKTMSYFSSASSASSAASVAQNAVDNGPSEPVVGWIVCIKGKHFGESFAIFAGKNSIGRNGGNRIVLSKENSVSREKHALIVYEPKKRRFYLQPGDSSGLTYLNDDYITESKLMNAKDIVELGDGRFMFVPLCDESFTWEDYITKE